MIIDREHIEAAIIGICRETGRPVPPLDTLTYGSLVVKYVALIDSSEVRPFVGDEVEKLMNGQLIKCA